MNEPNAIHERPRLRIIHFALWVACTFIMYSAYETTAVLTDVNGSVFRIINAPNGVLSGAATACAIIIGARYVRGQLSITNMAPGHMMALMMAIDSVFNVVSSVLSSTPIPLSVGIPVTLLIVLVAVGIRLLAVITFWHYIAWRTFFASETLLCVGNMIWSLLGFPERSTSRLVTSIPDFATILCLLVLIWACFNDQRVTKQRDWLHYVGVTAYGLISIWRVSWNVFGWRFAQILSA